MNEDRGTGRTTRQMIAAPKDAIYVWVNGNLAYPRGVAERAARKDLKIVSPGWITNQFWRGLELTGIVIDHAVHEHYGHESILWRYIEQAYTQIRKVDNSEQKPHPEAD